MIFGISIRNVLVSPEPWDNAHKLWFKKKAAQLEDDSVLEWVDRDDYFSGVDKVMQRLYPDMDEDKRTQLARAEYFDSVIEYLMTHDVVLKRNCKALCRQTDYEIAIITTNTHEAAARILDAANFTCYDHLFTSAPDEKDDKNAVLSRALDELGSLDAYCSSSGTDWCEGNDVTHIDPKELISFFE